MAAAKLIATQINAGTGFWSKVGDAFISIFSKDKPSIKITYADGGSESFYMNFLGSDVAYSEVPKSLSIGTGKVEEKNCFLNTSV